MVSDKREAGGVYPHRRGAVQKRPTRWDPPGGYPEAAKPITIGAISAKPTLLSAGERGMRRHPQKRQPGAEANLRGFSVIPREIRPRWGISPLSLWEGADFGWACASKRQMGPIVERLADREHLPSNVIVGLE